MTTSWVDFYNQLTNNGALVTQRRSANITSPQPFRFDYSPTSRPSSGSSAPKSKKKNDNPLSNLKYLMPGLGLVDDLVRKGEDHTTPGARLMDVLARGNYASANAFKSYVDQGPSADDDFHGFDPVEILKEAVEGASGKDKTTFRDVNEARGLSNDGFMAGARNFLYDVALDPTSYVGPGLIKAAAKPLKKIGQLNKSVEAVKDIGDGTKAVAQPLAVKELTSSAPTKAAPDKDFAKFIDQITRNKNNPGEKSIFDEVIDQSGNTVSGAVPSFERLFVAGADGPTERFMLPGPTPEVIAGRVSVSKADELAQKVPQFQYGSWIDEAPTTGPYKETVRKIPVEKSLDDADLTPEGKAEVDRARQIASQSSVARQKTALQAKYKGLAEAGDPDVSGPNIRPEVKVIMSQVDEPVFARYEPKTIETTTEAGRKQTIKVWLPNPEDVRDGNMMHMGEIRTRLLNPAVSKTEKTRLMGMLGNHVKAVEDWIKSGPPGFTGPQGQTAMYRELYGKAPKDLAKGARKPKAAATDDLGIPESPFEKMPPVPTYTEVREWQKMDWIEKLMFMQTNFNGLKPEHMTYLSQANSQKSFATRLAKLQTTIKEGGTENAANLVDAIKTGRIQAIDEEGIPELLAHYKVDSLKALATAVEKDLKSLSAAEKKMLGRITKSKVVTKETVAKNNVTKELGPTGQAYAPYEAKARKQAAQAKTKAAQAKAQSVVPAEKIIEGVLSGQKTIIETPKVKFDSSQQTMFDNALVWAVDKNVIGPKDAAIWQWVTKTGVKRTSGTPRKGTGRVQDAWNVYSQYDFFKGLLVDSQKVDAGVKSALNDMDVKGPDRLVARADFMYRLLMEPMRAMDNVLKQGGIFPVAGTRQYDTPFSFHDAFSSLPEEFVKKNIFTLVNSKAYGKGSRIAPTQLMSVMDVGVTAMRTSDSSDELSALIKAGLLEQKMTNAGKKVPNYLPYLNKKDPGAVDDIVNDIIDALPSLAQKAEKNAAERKLWHENQQFEGTQAALDEIATRVFADDYNVSESLKLAEDIDPIIKTVVRSKGIDLNDEFLVRSGVNAAMPELVETPVRAEAKRAHLAKTKKTKVEKTQAAVNQIEEAEDEVAKILGEEEWALRTFAEKSDNALTHKFITSFFPHWDNATLRPLYLNHNSATQTIARTFQGALAGVTKAHAKDDIMAAWKELQIGRWSSNPTIKAAQVDLNKVIGVMFSDDAPMSVFNRRGLTSDELNSHFELIHIHPKYHFENSDTMHNAWRQWDTNDPLQLMSQMFAATMKATGKKLLGDQMMHNFGSRTPKPGYVKLRAGKNEILKYVDTDSYYFPREIAREMHILDKFLETSMKPMTSGTGASALRVYDAALHAYKSGLTIYRPGHHVRNMVGEVWLSFMAGVTNPVVYSDAMRIMKQMRGRYNDFDAVTALAAGDRYVPENASADKFLSTNLGGKKTGLTASDVYRGLYDRGVLPDYRTLEDVQFGQENAQLFGGKIKPFGGKVHKVAATVSESHGHYIRLAHAIDVLKKGDFKTLDEAFDKAAGQVRKWHPDGSDLTHFESKFMRRTFMFYSWIRKAIPLVLEGMVMSPGRALVYPKAIYNMAEANGIDLESYSNPFPDDQMFPSYLTDGLEGPITQSSAGNYWGISPGVPMMDVLGDYGGSSPKSTVLSALSPAAKIPIEMAGGEKIGAVARDVRTDVPYFDKSDYIDKQIPNSSLAIGLTGRSPSNLFLEPKGGPDAEIKTDGARTLANFLSGMGLVDMSKPSTIKQAKREDTMRNNGR